MAKCLCDRSQLDGPLSHVHSLELDWDAERLKTDPWIAEDIAPWDNAKVPLDDRWSSLV